MVKVGSSQLNVSLICAVLACNCALSADEPSLDDGAWKRNGLATHRFQINGTGGRNNPLRRRLAEPFSGDELFFRYRIRYDASTIDTPTDGNGEFFVLWLDAVEGNDGSTHSAGIPNLGLHVAEDKNRFMIRFASQSEKYADALTGDTDFLLVGRLWKSTPGEEKPFDRLSLWVNPDAATEFKPQASVNSNRSVNTIKWIGFSTGAKTEIDDQIEVWDIDVAGTWEKILGLPPKKDAAPVQTRTVDFTTDVLPVLKSRCFKCHAGEEAREGIRLDILDEVLNRTVPRHSAQSHLIERIVKREMPPDGDAVSESELAVLKTWIDEGLEWNEKLLPTPIPQTDHWAFQPVRRPKVPTVKQSDWMRTPVDAFVAKQHERLGLTAAPMVSTQILQRRLSLDLLGLPPQQSGVSSVEKQLDEMLESVAFGERWGRHWLDVARWAESNGHQHNRERPFAWRYRDWVIDAFRKDKSVNRFIHEQIAGDQLKETENDTQKEKNIIAAGFLAAARYSGNEQDKDLQRNDILVDVANTTASAFLGLTLECAQCHTHKFDPISIRDYYRFQAVFANGQPGNVVLTDSDEARQLIAARWELYDKVEARLVSNRRRLGYPEPISVTPTSVVGGMNAVQQKTFKQLNEQIAKLPQSWSFYSLDNSEASIAPHEMRWPLPRRGDGNRYIPTSLLIRGDVKSPGPTVRPGWPAVFGASPELSDSPRRDLAEWMSNANNPLTARVWVNRIWQWHFGRGLVETSNDFGTQGSPPSHPELLDFLASELMEHDWSSRHIHKLILNSSTYRQSSRFSESNAAIDPDNRFLWRWTPRRLEAEAIRDSILAVSGELDSTSGGPSVGHNSKRRSVYLKQRRDNFPHQQTLFDGATGVVSCSRRTVATTALQPLWLMNDRFVQHSAKKFAERAQSVAQVMQLALGRPATEKEIKALSALSSEYGLASVCLAVLNSSEFIYIP